MLVVSFASCKKDDSPDSAKNSYFPLTNGSYWIYESYVVDSSGNEVLINNDIDSIVITGDTTINNKVYKVKSCFNYGHPTNKEFYRDSMGYILKYDDGLGERKIFSPTDFTNVLCSYDLPDVGCHLSCKMQKVTEPVSVKAGTYTAVLNGNCTVAGLGEYQANSFPDVKYYYAQGTGLVMNTLYYMSGWINLKSYTRVELIRYKIYPD